MPDLVTVASCDTVSEADTLKFILEQQGFEVYLSNDNLVAMDWLISNAVGGALIQVPSNQAEKAKHFMQEYRSKEKARREAADQTTIYCRCPDCRGSLSFAGSRAGRTDSCVHCGAYIDVPLT